MVNRKTASALTIAALLACTISPKSVVNSVTHGAGIEWAKANGAADWLAPAAAQSAIAQALPSFPVPDNVAKGTNVRLSSSSENMKAVSTVLGTAFEAQYADSKVTIASKDTNAALQDVLNDNADLAAINRPLTDEEKAKGLIEVPVRREKIAVVVSQDNPFTGSITGSQFAQIFRGEIKDWSSVGGQAGPIKMVDHAEASETRQALRPYPVFKTAAFKTVGGATILSENTPEALAKALGKEGIGYLLVGQLEGQSALRALELHKTPPTDARYPFSQPYSYVYAGGASPAAMAFLGYATGSPGQSAIEQANLSGNGVSSSASGATAAAGTNAGATAGATDGTAASGANGGGGENIPGAAGSNSTSTGADTNAGTGADSGGEASAPTGAITDAAGSERWWWLLLPLAGLGLLIWAAGRRGSEEETGYIANADRDDDRIRRSFEGSGFEDTALPGTQLGAARVGIDNPDVDSSQFTASGPSMGKVIAGGSAIAGGAAAGLAGRAKAASGDVTMDLSAVDLDEGRANDGIRNITRDVRETTGSMGNIPSNIQAGTGGIEGVRTRIQGQIDGVEEMGAGARTHLQGHLQGGSDSLRQTFTAETTEGSWLDRAKQRINEATEQIKDTAADIKDDITKE